MAALSHKVFLDTSTFISLIDRTHLHHQKTVALFELLARQGYTLYTSSLVVFQAFSQMERELGSAISLDFLQAILDSSIKVIYASESELLFAYRFFKNSTQRQLSLVELVNARIMEKNGITNILTYDYWHNIAGTIVSNLMSS